MYTGLPRWYNDLITDGESTPRGRAERLDQESHRTCALARSETKFHRRCEQRNIVSHSAVYFGRGVVYYVKLWREIAVVTFRNRR